MGTRSDEVYRPRVAPATVNAVVHPFRPYPLTRAMNTADKEMFQKLIDRGDWTKRMATEARWLLRQGHYSLFAPIDIAIPELAKSPSMGHDTDMRRRVNEGSWDQAGRKRILPTGSAGGDGKKCVTSVPVEE